MGTPFQAKHWTGIYFALIFQGKQCYKTAIITYAIHWELFCISVKYMQLRDNLKLLIKSKHIFQNLHACLSLPHMLYINTHLTISEFIYQMFYGNTSYPHICTPVMCNALFFLSMLYIFIFTNKTYSTAWQYTIYWWLTQSRYR